MHGLKQRVAKLTSILDVAKALTEERDLDRLLHLVVSEATKIVGAERSSMFIYDRDRNELWSQVAEGTGEIRIPADAGLAGSVVQTGLPINIPDAYADARFNRGVDQQTGYRTRSLLTVPMKNARGEVVGVLQALNRTDGEPFDDGDTELLMALAGVGGSAISNVLLKDEIEKLFEGFAKASVVAIESRDPTTAGHSERVADVSMGLAVALERSGGLGRWKGAQLTREQLQELRYAALLHDFGKVGVREHVLAKATKLYPGDLDVLDARFEAIRSTLQAESTRRKLDLALAGASRLEERLAEEDARLAARLRELDELYEFVHVANRPTVLAEGSFERLNEIAQQTWQDSRGQQRPFLTDREVRLLSVRRGSLSEEEREEIESHVTHTYRFLSQIPWTRALRNVPLIAYGHHEKLSGEGYPLRLGDEAIPLQTRMITISDIYDALTATDRPYKRAVRHERALDILQLEADEGHLDQDLLRLFIEADVPRRRLGD